MCQRFAAEGVAASERGSGEGLSDLLEDPKWYGGGGVADTDQAVVIGS